MREQGKLFIDGRDALLEYGIFVEKGGYKAIVQFPSFKKIESTEWPEYDGEEVDLTAPVLGSKTFSVQFCITKLSFAEELFDELATGAYHLFEFRELKKTYKLRMTSNGTFSSFVNLGKLTLSFADDFPIVPKGSPYKYGKSGIRQSGYELDGVDFSQFGSYILKGTDDAVRKAPTVRNNLTIDITSLAGLKYDDDNVTFKTKDVAVKLLINADSIDEFWKRWNSLFAVFLQSEHRSFYFSALGNEYECYYKSNHVRKFEIMRNGHIWCEFTLTLIFTSSRPVGSYLLLATEDFDWVITEQEEARIRIRPKSGLTLLITENGEYVITEDDSSQIYFN